MLLTRVMGDAVEKEEDEDEGAGVTALKSVHVGASKSQGSGAVTLACTTSAGGGRAAAAGTEGGGGAGMLLGPPLSPRTKSKYWGALKSYGSGSVAMVLAVGVAVWCVWWCGKWSGVRRCLRRGATRGWMMMPLGKQPTPLALKPSPQA